MNKDFNNLISDIIGSANLDRQEATGFYALHCPICNKEDRKTGGFKFENDQIIYNCFRGSCDASTVYTLDQPVPRKFKNLMDTIGVRIPMPLRSVRNSVQKMMQHELDKEFYEENHFKEIEIPEEWELLSDATGFFAEKWQDYLAERSCDLRDVWLIKSGIYRNLIAIAIHFFDKCIGFQIVTGKDEGVKYILETENDGCIYLPDREPSTPLIVVEGCLDAKCFPNTVATLKSKLNAKQAYHLRNRELWFLPDKSSNNFIKQMRDYDAKIIIPNWKYNDLNEAVCNLGVMEVAHILKNNVIDNYHEAVIKYNLWRDKG